MTALKHLLTGTLLVLITGLSACGGGGSSSVATGIGGTGKIASGSITRFGSIFVNGVEYDIDSAACTVDGSNVTGQCQANLDIGMVVTVTGTVDGARGTADSVVFTANAEGPVTALVTQPDGLTRTFTILGTPVIVDTATTLFDDGQTGFSFATLGEGNVVKLSGFVDAAGVLHATFVRKLADSATLGTTAVKLKGTATNVSGSGGTAGDSFTLNGTTVSLQATTDLSDLPGNAVGNGDLVTVYGVITGANSVDATRIEMEDSALGDDGDEVSLEGLVSGFNGDLGSFLIDGRPVDARAATLNPSNLTLSNGLKVEAEGTLTNGVLIASELENRDGDIKVDAIVSAKTASTLTVTLGDGSLTVNTDSRTRLEDSTGTTENLLLGDINTGDFLQIRGFLDNGGITASEIHREVPEKILLQGPVDSFINGSSITVLGITFFTDGSTEFEDNNDSPLTSSAFYGALSAGATVKIEDRHPGDGTADEVDLED